MSNAILFDNWKAVASDTSRWRKSGVPIEIWDADVRRGDVRPFACPTLCGDIPVQTLYPLDPCPCFGFPFKTYACQSTMHDIHWFLMDGLIHEVTTEQLCNGEYGLLGGLPPPAYAPTVHAECEWFHECETDVPNDPENPDNLPCFTCDSCNTCDNVAVSYVITFRSHRNGRVVESSPSPASIPISSNGMFPNSLVEDFAPVPDGYGITSIGIYRLIQSHLEGQYETVEQGEFVFVKEIPVDETSFRDVYDETSTLWPLSTYQPLRFPAPPNLIALTKVEDKIAVADLHRVYVSLPGEAMFTYDGVIEIEDEIRAIASVNNDIVVLTNRDVYHITVKTIQEGLQVSRQNYNVVINFTKTDTLSIFNKVVMFAGEDGLYLWSDHRLVNIAQANYAPADWKHIYNGKLVGSGYAYGYLLWSEHLGHSLLFDWPIDGWVNVSNAKGQVMPITFVNPVESMAVNRHGHLMYSNEDGVFDWDWRRIVCNYTVFDQNKQAPCDWCETCDWKVVLFYNNRGKNSFRYAIIYFDERSGKPIEVTTTLMQHGYELTEAHKLQVIRSRSFRLPYSQVGTREIMMEIIGNVVMDAVIIASSNQETTKMRFDRTTGEEV